jgi:hypothetical protein
MFNIPTSNTGQDCVVLTVSVQVTCRYPPQLRLLVFPASLCPPRNDNIASHSPDALWILSIPPRNLRLLSTGVPFGLSGQDGSLVCSRDCAAGVSVRKIVGILAGRNDCLRGAPDSGMDLRVGTWLLLSGSAIICIYSGVRPWVYLEAADDEDDDDDDEGAQVTSCQLIVSMLLVTGVDMVCAFVLRF